MDLPHALYADLSSRCDVYVRVAAILNIVSGICAAGRVLRYQHEFKADVHPIVFYATRTFALYSRNYPIFFLTLFLGLIGPAINIVRVLAS